MKIKLYGKKAIVLFLAFLFLDISFVLGNNLEFVMPYIKDGKIRVSRAYDYGTHINKDSYALDFDLAVGDKVVAVEGGIIEDAKIGYNGGYGNYIDIKHSDNLISRYTHLNEVFIKKGDQIIRGQLIGEVGNTGKVIPKPTPENPNAGDHLHFAIYKVEKYVNGAGIETERLIAYKPEPLYNCADQIEENQNEENLCENFAVGRKYVSLNKDNSSELVQAKSVNEIVKNQTQTNNSNQNNSTQSSSGFWGFAGGLVSGFVDNAVDSLMSVSNVVKNVGENIGEKIADAVKPDYNKDESGNKIAGDADNYNPSDISNSSNVLEEKESLEEMYNSKLMAQAAFGVSDKFSKTIILNPEQEITLSAQYKNTGSKNWERNNVSLNYVGFQTKQFYHPGWLTEKRPSRLDQSIAKSGQAGGFTFPIKAPNIAGLYTFSARPVVFYNGNYEWLGNDIASWSITVIPKLVILEEDNFFYPDSFIENNNSGNDKNNDSDNSEGEVKGASDVDGGEIDNLEEDKKNPINYFYGGGCGGCGGSSGEENNNGNGEENNNQNNENNDEEESNQTPETYLEKYPAKLANENFAEFAFHSDMGEAVFKCRMGDEEFLPCASPLEYENLEDGERKFEVKSIYNDAEDPTPANHIWTIDTIPPGKISDLEANSTENNKANLSWTLPDDEISGITIYYNQEDECSEENLLSEDFEMMEIIFNETGGGQSALEIINLDGGKNYCFGIKAADAAGNVSEISNIVSVKIAFENWSESFSVFNFNSGADIESFSMDIDKNGETGAVLALSDYCDENEYCYDEALLYKKDIQSNSAEIILNSEESALSGFSNLSLKIDSDNIAHIVFQSRDSSALSPYNATENIYYINSSDLSKVKRIIYSAYNPQFEIGADNSLHISAISENNYQIYYSQCAKNCLEYINWLAKETYESEDIFGITSLSMKISDDNNLYFAILADNDIFSPPLLSLASQNNLSLPYMIAPSGLKLYYINKNSDGWNAEAVEGSYALFSTAKISMAESSPMIAINGDDNILYLFSKDSNNIWKNKLEDLDPEFSVDMDFSFETDSRNYIHIISADYGDGQNLRWTTDFPDGVFRKITIESIREKFSEIYHPQLAISKNKAGIVFEGKGVDDEDYLVYYIEREIK